MNLLVETQEPLYVMTLSSSLATPILVIETKHSQKRSSCVQLVTVPYQLPWLLTKLGYKTAVKAG